MSELKAYDHEFRPNEYGKFYLKSEADKVITEKDAEIAQLQAMLEERNKQVGELKDRIAPKQSDKTLQERLNEVCKKHGVSTLQDLDWAFCESKKRHTRDNIEVVKGIRHHKYKRCLAMARIAEDDWYLHNYFYAMGHQEFEKRKCDFYEKWRRRWLELAEQFKEVEK